jgi:hypothetical protein
MAATYDALLRINAKATGAGEVRNLGNAIGGLSKSAAGLGAIAGSITGLGVALGGIGLAAAGKGIIDMADSLDELSQRSGASVESLSKLGAAARMSGLDTEQVSAGLVRLSRNLGEIASGGGKDAKAALDQLGVSAFNASGELRKPDEVMFDLIDSMANLEDGGTKTRLSMELLGKSGAALIPMFNMGAEAIKGLNTGISEEFAKNAGIYNDRMEELKMQFTALGVTVLDQLLPSMIKGTEFIGGLISSAQGWLKENEGALGAFVKGIASAAVEVAKLAGPVFAAVIAYKAYQSAVAAATFIQGAFNAATIANPIGLLAMAAGLGIGAVAMAKIAAEMKKAKEEGDRLAGSAGGFEKALQGAEDNLEQITLKQQESAAAAEVQKAAAEALRKTEEDRTYWLERAGSAYEKQAAQIDLISAANQRRTALAGEENTLAQAYNNLGKTILQNRLELAKTDEEKLAISKQIAQIESESARLQLEATKLQIQAEEELKAAALNRAISNRKAIESTMALAAAMYNAGQLGMDKIMTYRLELDKAKGAADTAQMEFNQARRINNVKTQAANINYQAAVLQATGGVPASANPGVPAAMGNQTPRRYTTIAGIRIPEYATGGYVTRPTLAMIGEGGEPEYVVPKSKAKAFANNIASGRTGDQALKPSWREIALETLANSPGDYMRAANAIMTGRRKQGMTWNMHEEERVRTDAIRSLGFGVTDVSPTYGRQVTRSRPLASIRGELEDLRARRSAGMAPGQASITLNTRVDKVVRQDGEDRVTLAQAQALASDAARQAVAQMDGNLKSLTYRQKRGIR